MIVIFLITEGVSILPTPLSYLLTFFDTILLVFEYPKITAIYFHTNTEYDNKIIHHKNYI
jgi:hypothetical protein